jgi:hypothetical protein
MTNHVSLHDVSPVDPVVNGDYIVFTLDEGLTLEVLTTEAKKHYTLTLVQNTLSNFKNYQLCVHVGDETFVTFEFLTCDSSYPMRWFTAIENAWNH